MSGYNLRSAMSSNTTVSNASPSTQSANISAATATLDTISKMINDLTPTSQFEEGVKTCISLLASQLTEIKIDNAKRQQEVLFRHKSVMENVDRLNLSVVKNEQYTRRDTVTVVGLPFPQAAGVESQSELCTKVATELSKSGETVTVSDLSAVHRNSKANRSIKGKTVPPSVTVRFCKVNKKDNVVRGYKNFDSTNKRPRDVKVYQSLSHHYSTLRRTMFNFFNAKPDNTDFGPIVNNGLKVKWVTYQSPTSGFAFKLETGQYFNGIHMWYNFVDLIMDKFPACRLT